jgi:hypothetical protein
VSETSLGVSAPTAPSINVSEFVDLGLLERVPYVFPGLSAYLVWRRMAAELLSVDPRNIMIVGSAAHGFSIKNGKPYDEESDVDVAVISAVHFDDAWRFMKTAKLGSIVCTPAQRQHIRERAAGYVYRGCIATDYILPLLPFGPEWQKASGSLSMQMPGGAREVNFRLYRDIESLRSYQEFSHKKLRKNWEPHVAAVS